MTPLEQALQLRLNPLPTPGDEAWPEVHWQAYRQTGVFAWTIPAEHGGAGFEADQVMDGSLELARAELVPAFVLSQFQSGCSRIVASDNQALRERWLPLLARGEAMTTIGISHLTTSRQHVSTPAVQAVPDGDHFRVTGDIPWVTSGDRADVLVAGATLSDGRQILFALPMKRDGVTVPSGARLLALTGSSTGAVHLRDVQVRREELLAGPSEQVLQQGKPGGAGSLTTSAMALGHAYHCVDAIAAEAVHRPALQEIVDTFTTDLDLLRTSLLAAAQGETGPDLTAETLRTRTTALALSTSQSLMTVSKGAGFVAGHPAERLAREAMFFLVWSCPQVVSQRLLREFSQCGLMG